MKSIFIFIAVGFLGTQLRSQTLIGKGLKAGVSSSWFGETIHRPEDDQVSPTFKAKTTSLLGLSWGGYLKFRLVDRLSLQSEALFSHRGSKIKLDAGTYKENIYYFETPVLLRWNVLPGAKIDPFVGVGFGPAFRRYAVTKSKQYDSDKASDTWATTWLVWIPSASIGIETKRVNFEIRYSAVRTKTSPLDETQYEYGPYKVRSYAWSFLLEWPL